MTALVIFTILFLLFVAAFTGSRRQKHPEDRQMAGATAAVLLVLTIGVGVASGFTHTKSNEISINHNFGTYQDTTGPGITWVGPFTQSEKFSTRIQPKKVENHKVTLKAEKEGAAGASARIWYTLRYHIDGTKHAEKMWRQYRNFDKVTKDLVVPESKTAAFEVFGQYTPAES